MNEMPSIYSHNPLSFENGMRSQRAGKPLSAQPYTSEWRNTSWSRGWLFAEAYPSEKTSFPNAWHRGFRAAVNGSAEHPYDHGTASDELWSRGWEVFKEMRSAGWPGNERQQERAEKPATVITDYPYAYSRGYRAQEEGSMNPYPGGTHRNVAWDLGYRRAEEDATTKEGVKEEAQSSSALAERLENQAATIHDQRKDILDQQAEIGRLNRDLLAQRKHSRARGVRVQELLESLASSERRERALDLQLEEALDAIESKERLIGRLRGEKSK